jgi:protein gp37
MGENSKIEWTDATWNPIRDCTRKSEGCRNCYAEVMAARFSDPGQWGHGLAQRVALPGGGIDHRWTGKVELVDSALDLPLRWRRPRRIFVNSTSDLFHEKVPDEWIDRVFAVMALAPQHTFQVLTKRPERMREYMAGLGGGGRTDIMSRAGGRLLRAAENATRNAPHVRYDYNARWPLPNVWLGTSVEDQATADDRIPHLLATPAAVRFLSAEPLLGPLSIAHAYTTGAALAVLFAKLERGDVDPRGNLHWVICGGESGPGARPMHPDWARSLRDQCQAAGVPFFMKQM